MRRHLGERFDLTECYSEVASHLLSQSLDRQGVLTLLEDAGALLLQPRSITAKLSEQSFVTQVEALARQRTSEDAENPEFSALQEAELPAVYQQFQASFAERLERLERERAEAGSLLEELRQQPGLRRKWVARNIRRFQSFGLAEHILEDLVRIWHSEPRKAVELSELALEVSEQLAPDRYGAGLINDLRGRCLAALGNSRRVLGQRANVEEVFQASLYYLNQGTGNPAERANFLQLKASWRRSQGRIDEAVELLNEAATIFQELGLRDRQANVLIQMAFFIGQEGRLEEAMEILQRVQNDFSHLNPRSTFYAHHNYTAILAETGRYQEGLARISEGREMAEQLGDRLDEQRVNWLEGQLLCKVGRLKEAEKLFREARDRFLESGKGLEAVGPALDLVRLLINQEEADEQGIARELLAFFPSREVQQNVLEALLYLSKALQRGEADADLVDQLEAFLGRAQANPSAVFEPADRA